MPAPDYEFISGPEMKAEIKRLQQRVKHLEDLIRWVVTQEDDNIYWRDVYTKLAAEIGLDFTPKLLAKKEWMKANCDRFIDSIYSGPYIPVYVKRND